MITVIISEVDSPLMWMHRARTKDALTAIIRAMRRHFPVSHNFIPDDMDSAAVMYAAVAVKPEVKVTGHIWKPVWDRDTQWNDRGVKVTVTFQNYGLLDC